MVRRLEGQRGKYFFFLQALKKSNHLSLKAIRAWKPALTASQAIVDSISSATIHVSSFSEHAVS
jgi:hypothetical protein